MADDTQAQAATGDTAASQADAAAAAAQQGTTTTDDTAATTATTTDDTAAAQQGDSDQVKALRQEAAARRKELREAQAKLKEFEEAQLSEQEKLTKRATEAETRASALEEKAKAALLRAEITAAAAKAGVSDVNDATLLLPSVGQVEWDDDTGEPTNIADLVTKLVEAKPYLVGQQDDPPARDPRTQKTAPATPRRSGGRFTQAQVNAMTPQQIAALSDEDFAAAQAVFSK